MKQLTSFKCWSGWTALIAIIASAWLADNQIGCAEDKPANGPRADDASAVVFDEASLEYFEKKVRPLLVERCFECHAGSSEKVKGGLRLDSRSAVLAGGDTGPAAIAGMPAKSLLIDAINYGNLYQMPPKSKMSADEVQVLTRWVEMGLPWTTAENPDRSNDGAKAGTFDLRKRMGEHWSWSEIVRPAVPDVNSSGWSRSAIDRFIVAGLESRGIPPAPHAEPDRFLRRMTLDLMGLPPELSDLATFRDECFALGDADEALDRSLDRLLASPAFGERWARHWMDLVRFAETRGHEFEPSIPNAWQYRDYLIRAFNNDVPYDQFVREHLAGDLIENPRPHSVQGTNESILGTGFWFLGEEVHSPVDIRQDEADRLDNRLDVMSKTFLGLTVGCARCHDHKFDAISQQDYYALTGFLLSASYRQFPFESADHNRQIAEQLWALRAKARAAFLARFAEGAQATVERLDEYLSAAVTLAPRLVNVTGAFESMPESLREEIRRVADERRLAPTLLASWTLNLVAAADQPSSPLHALAQLSLGRQQDAARLLEQWDKTRPETAAKSPTTGTLLDFSDPARTCWYVDGVAYGAGPVAPGDFVIAAAPVNQEPRLRWIERPAARRDPLFHNPVTSPDNEADPGALGGWQRAGRSLRTLSVTLDSGSLYYLVKGAGRAYAVVDSHLVIAGPLHGRVLLEWDAPADQWKWIRHDLTPYRGHRVHVEFVPKNEGEFQIAKAVESMEEPPLPAPRNAWLADALVERSRLSDQPGAIKKVMAETLSAMREAASSRTALPASAVEWANWMLDHQPLFFAGAESSLAEWRKLLQEYTDQEQALARQIQFSSRLAMAMFDGNGVDERLLVRGSTRTPGDIVPRRTLEALGGTPADGYGTGSGRLRLADQLLAADNPYPARVMANRLWHHLFGRGIVPTVDNFGVLGQRPTHPELLDWLTSQFRGPHDWSVKRTLRMLVQSQTYRMDSRPEPSAAANDPGNESWHHIPVRRLQAEPIRDLILAVSGRLDRKMLGPPIEVHLTPFMDGRGKPGSSGPLDGAGRRSLYIKVRRNFLPPMMLAFDSPIPFSTIGRRTVSNVPAQALILLNDPFVVQQANEWARSELAIGVGVDEQIRNMYLSALGREPETAELRSSHEFFAQQGAELGISAENAIRDIRVWSDFAHVLFNTKEFLFVP
ncbi:MAG: DUF1553 domain-containing protein [Planctomycetes bacterium]|nr:DUF1553 domain-containing protein [Planctomycetota bacterium]